MSSLLNRIATLIENLCHEGQYEEFLQCAQSARLCDRVVSGSPAEDIPGDGKWDVGVLQVQDIASQLGDASVFGFLCRRDRAYVLAILL